MALLKKYLSHDEIKAIIGEIQVPKDFVLMSQDSYNETAIAAKIAQTGKAPELLCAAINMAVVGIGNKRYGNYRQGNTVVDIVQLLQACGVLFKLGPGTVLAEDALTVQRLCRFYRYDIRDYLRKNAYPTYLFRKYSSKKPEMNEILFRGAEYLDDLTEEQSQYLRETIGNLDQSLGTTIIDRYDRIRGAVTGTNKVL